MQFWKYKIYVFILTYRPIIFNQAFIFYNIIYTIYGDDRESEKELEKRKDPCLSRIFKWDIGDSNPGQLD